MKMHLLAVAIAVLNPGAGVVAQPPTMPGPQKEHDWLKQFVGEWDSESEVVAMPGQPAMKSKGTMTSRMLGGFWVVSDIKGDMMGTPMQAISTVGYDPQSKKYTGTWVDSMMNHLWKYQGTVDSTGKILSLEAEGPHFTKPGAMAKYRDIYEFKTKDQIAMSSQVLGDDGKWTQFMTSTIQRKKK
jgi:Protein of unknown function (DUF1579)